MKKYGLQLRVPASQQKKQSSKPPLHPPPIFSADDDDEDINGEIARQATKKKVLRDVEEQHKKALAEDPTVFDYDGNYDQMKEETARPLMQDRQEPKYIHTLMAEAKARERHQEVVYERKLAKERSKDDHLYEGKGKFVTSAYKKKLAEQAKWLEEERIRDEKEDVITKKSHGMSDFYLNLGKNVAFGGAGGADSSVAVKREVKGIAETPERDVSPVMKPPSSSGASETNVYTSEGKVVATDHSLQVSNVEPKPMAGQSDQDPREKREAALSAAKERFLARKKAKQQ